jgi:DNA-binding HxlR family transcriptional regulator
MNMTKQSDTSLDNRVCSVARAIDILGDRWIFLILREAFFRVRYYDQFQANLGIATNILSNRLKKLVENGIMEKQKDELDSRKNKYRLTGKGRDLYAVTLAFMQWGDKWLIDENGPPLLLQHKLCDHRLTPVMCCKNCKEEIHVHDVTYEELWKNKKTNRNKRTKQKP